MAMAQERRSFETTLTSALDDFDDQIEALKSYLLTVPLTHFCCYEYFVINYKPYVLNLINTSALSQEDSFLHCII